LRLSSVLVKHQAAVLDGSALDARTLQQDGLPPAEIDISQDQVASVLAIATRFVKTALIVARGPRLNPCQGAFVSLSLVPTFITFGTWSSASPTSSNTSAPSPQASKSRAPNTSGSSNSQQPEFGYGS
jgi:hypothetical protein